MSLSRNRQTKMSSETGKENREDEPAIPDQAEMASGIDAEIVWLPAWTFSAAPLSPSHDSSPDSRNVSTVAESCCRTSRTPPTIGTRNKRPSTVTRIALPITVTVAASPRDIPVFAITTRTGYSNTSARKIPTNTIKNVSPISQKAATTPTEATTSKTVRIGRSNSTRDASRIRTIRKLRIQSASIAPISRAVSRTRRSSSRCASIWMLLP